MGPRSNVSGLHEQVGRQTVTATSGDTSAQARIEAIRGRLALLREQTAQLRVRIDHASERAREVRERPPVMCNHAAQVAQMQAAIDGLEHELDGLRTAMETRGVIEQAKGMLMLHRQCDADEAFRLLVDLSQTSHRKLFEVAQTLVASWTAGDRAEA